MIRADAGEVFAAAFAGFVVLMIALLVVAVVVRARRERRHWEHLNQVAAHHGWRPVPLGAPLPEVVRRDAASRRTRLVLGRRYQDFDVWLVWHRWTETHTVGDSTSSSTHNLTRHYLWLGPRYPDVRVERRTGLGGLLRPVRGVGTGDAAFDKAYMVRTDWGPEATRLLIPPVREAMLAGWVPGWQVRGGVLIISRRQEPTGENLQPWTDTVVHLARMLR